MKEVQGFAPSGGGDMRDYATKEVRVPALTGSLDRIEKTLAAAHERAETATLALGRISLAPPMTPTAAGRERGPQPQGPSTVETRLQDISEGVDGLLAKIDFLSKLLNALV